MKIQRLEVVLFKLPFIKPFNFSGGSLEYKESVLLKLFSEGLTGYGEGATQNAPVYLPEYSRSSYLVLRDFIAPLLVGKTFDSVEELIASYSSIRGYHVAKCAAETAFWDLWSQKAGIPLWSLLGGVQRRIQVGESLGIRDSLPDLLAEVEERIDEGYKRIKVKIQPGWDILPVRAIRERFPDISLMVDANSAYTLRDINLFKEFDELALLMIEQPLAYDDIIDHALLQKAVKTPICLDESILSVEHARKALQIGACRIINIKPVRVGGLVESRKIHDLCTAHDVGVCCGGMLESSIGRFFNLAIASLPGFIYPADMSPSKLIFREEVVRHPLDVKDGFASVPSFLFDFGVDDSLIEAATIERTVFSS